MSKVLPILFNTDMVRAILDGRKTVTRRVIKPQPKMHLCYVFAGADPGKWRYPDKDAWKFWGEQYKRSEAITEEDSKMFWTPPCHTDDILYVRETFKCKKDGYSGIDFGGYIYKADCKTIFKDPYNPWTPSIHMPKEVARIWLKVTDVRVERLQDMETADDKNFIAEGASDKHDFINIWDSTVKDRDTYGWYANPWIWVIEFGRCAKPECEVQ